MDYLRWLWSGVVMVYADLRYSYYTTLETAMIEQCDRADPDVVESVKKYLCMRGAAASDYERGLLRTFF